MYEVEFRAKFDEETHKRLRAYLDTHAENLGEDDKDCYYYGLADKFLKLVNNLSKKTAKVSLKLNRIGNGAVFQEIEFFFPPDQFEKAHQLFTALKLPAKIMRDPQRRINYRYCGCELALKHSNTWGHHLEIEQMIEDMTKRHEAERQIQEVAEELGVTLMSEEELGAFIKAVEDKL